jgi:abequosyltransferase
LLTIAIPTYNRAGYLRELLSSLFDQLVAAAPRLELIISNNASPDNTDGVVRSFYDRGLRFDYINNSQNIGADANFLQCFERARGKYVWILSDDDHIVPGGIAHVLDLLAKDDYQLVYLASYGFRKDYLSEMPSVKRCKNPAVYHDGLSLVRRVGTMITFVSAIIVNKDYYLNATHLILNELVGSNFIHLGWVGTALASGSNILFVRKRIVAGRIADCRDWAPGKLFGAGLKEVSEKVFGVRRDIANTLCNMTLENWFPMIILKNRLGIGSKLERENLRRTIEPIYRNNWRYWCFVYPVLTLPLRFAGLWCRVNKLLIHILARFHTRR